MIRRFFRFTILNELCLGAAALVVLGAVLVPSFPGHRLVCRDGHYETRKEPGGLYLVPTYLKDGTVAAKMEMRKGEEVREWVCNERSR
jgi:hypothetical protein